jgi:hypothetical protein
MPGSSLQRGKLKSTLASLAVGCQLSHLLLRQAAALSSTINNQIIMKTGTPMMMPAMM